MKINKKSLLLACATAFAVVLCVCVIPIKAALAGSQYFVVPDEAKPVSVNFLNGSFEQPEVTNVGIVGQYFEYIPMESVPGWDTIPVNSSDYSNPSAYCIEIQKVNTGGAAGFATTQADGDQYAELNCDVVGRLYQSVATTPGSRILWQFAHRAIGSLASQDPGSGVTPGNDTMNFYLRPDTAPATAPTESQLVQTANDDSNSWHYYNGVYHVPAGQSVTQFIFQSISTWTNHPTHGNFLDDIKFQTGAKIIAKKSIDTSAADNSTALKGETVTITVAITNWGETDASRCVFYDILSDDLAYVAGSARINGVSAGDLAYFDTSSDTVRVNFGAGAAAGLMSIDGGVLKGSQSMGTSGSTGQGETITISFQATVTGDIGEIVKNQASIVYCDKDFENFNGMIMCSYSSVSGRTVASGDETSYVNRFTIVGGSINGRVWYDADADGLIETGENRDTGRAVGLYLTSDTTFSNPIQTVTANALSVYHFTQVPAGSYKVAAVTPSGYVVTKHANDNDAVASGTRSVISGLTISSTTVIANQDIGFTQNRTISGRAWYDADADGTIDTGETRISGLTVGIYANTDTTYITPVNNIYGTALTTTTNTSGVYSFSYIPQGTYKIVVSTPGGYVVTVLANDNNASPSGSRAVISNVALTTATSASNMDFGFVVYRTISGRAWYDANRNGTIDGLSGTGGEEFASGLTVSVYLSTDTSYTTPATDIYGAALTTTTNSGGQYGFARIPQGTYKIVVSTPSGYAVTVHANDNDAVASGTRAVIDNVALTTATSVTYMDFGFAPSRRISGVAWYDADADGMIDAGESRAQGIVLGVFLNSTTNYMTPVSSVYGFDLVTTTENNGEYVFSGVPSGVFKVVQRYKEPNCVLTIKTSTTDNDAITSNSWFLINSIDLTSAMTAENRDFGYIQNRSVAGRAWYDADADGAIDTGETRISGMTVGIYANTDTTYSTPVNSVYGTALTTTTNTSGEYSFSYIPAGTFKIVVTTPTGYVVTVLANDNNASASGTRAIISDVTLAAAESVTNMDFGFRQNKSISGRVWNDADADGAIETGESRFSSISVGVYQNADTTCSSPVLDIFGNPLTTSTDTSGNYSFAGVPAGTYKVVAEMPDGYIVTKLANDNDAVAFNLRAMVSNIDVTTENTVENVDFGYVENRTVSGRVWLDLDADGAIDPADGLLSGTIYVRLFNASDSTLANDVFGYPLVRIVSATGTYQFTGVPAGTYFTAIVTPTGYYVTVLANDNDAVSEAGGNAVVRDIDLTMERNIVDRDFGFIQARSISGRVWYDVNEDGTIDESEARVSGVSVGVYAITDTTCSTPILDLLGNPLTTTTSSTGTYSFANVPAGIYYIVVSRPASGYIVTRFANDNDAKLWGDNPRIENVDLVAASNVVDMDCGFTVFRSIDGRFWLDDDMDGAIDWGELRLAGWTVGVYAYSDTIYTTPINNLYGQPMTMQTKEGSPYGEFGGEYNFSYVPRGIYKIVNATPTGFIVTILQNDNDASPSGSHAVISGVDLTTETFSLIDNYAHDKDFGFTQNKRISGRVWFDMNADGMVDTGEARLSGITVTLFDINDTAFANPVDDIFGNTMVTTTNANGEYSFAGIPSGTFRAVIEMPEGMHVTQKTASTDNDAELSGTRAITDGYAFTGATVSYEDVDFGFGIVFNIQKNASVNGGSVDNGTAELPVGVAVGDTIEYTILVNWDSASGISSIGTADISDIIPLGLELQTGTGSYTSGMTWSTDAATGQTTILWDDVDITSDHREFKFQVKVTSPEEGAEELLYVNTAEVQTQTDTETSNSTYHDLGTRTITITKIVKGDLSDPKQGFDFRITLNDIAASLNYHGLSIISGVSAPADGVIYSGFARRIVLKHGQGIVIENVPVGIVYSITETLLFSGYSVTISETNGGSITPLGSTGVQGSVTSNIGLLFTNTKNAVIPTGVILSILPYAILAGLSGGVVVLSLALARKRKLKKRFREQIELKKHSEDVKGWRKTIKK